MNVGVFVLHLSFLLVCVWFHESWMIVTAWNTSKREIKTLQECKHAQCHFKMKHKATMLRLIMEVIPIVWGLYLYTYRIWLHKTVDWLLLKLIICLFFKVDLHMFLMWTANYVPTAATNLYHGQLCVMLIYCCVKINRRSQYWSSRLADMLNSDILNIHYCNFPALKPQSHCS